MPDAFLDLASEHFWSREESRDLHSFVSKAKERDLAVDWDDLYPVLQHSSDQGLSPTPPPHVVEFIGRYLQARGAHSVLDPAADPGVLATGLLSTGKFETVHAVFENDNLLELASLAALSAGDQWRTSTLGKQNDITDRFNAVVGHPPMGHRRRERWKFSTPDGSEIEVKEDLGNLLIAQSLQRLTEDGVGIFIVPPSFFFGRSKRTGLLATLPALGFQVQAAIELPSGTLAPLTNIVSYLTFVSRASRENIFAARLEKEQNHTTLLDNLHKHQKGQVLELGCLVPADEFESFSALKLEEEIGRLASRSGTQAVPLSSLTKEINSGKRTEDGGFEEHPEAVYLPRVGTSEAVVDLSHGTITAQNYTQIVLETDNVDADYLAAFFNSPLGRLVRERLGGPSHIPHISLAKLREATVYRPPREQQSEILSTLTSISQLRLRLDESKKKLWMRPVDVDEVSKEVEALQPDESLEAWTETLPFPLASVLRRAIAVNDVDDQVNHLFHFFEGMAQFLATLLLSAFRSDSALFERYVQSRNNSKGHSLKKSSFGNWTHLYAELSKEVRRMLSDGEEADRCLRLFRTSRDRVELACNKTLFNILDQARKHRNDWKGHDYIFSESERKRHLTKLESLLAEVREVVSNVFSEWRLIRPDGMRFRSGVYHHEVDVLVGPHRVFTKDKEVTLQAMDESKLYMLAVGERKPLELIPFFRIMAAPKTESDACYFYSRVDQKGVRLVSYHYEAEAEIIDADARPLLDVIEELEGS